MVDDVTHGDEEIRHLRSSINDLISIQALPTIWDARESGSIVSTLLDVLVSILQLDFAYVRLSASINGSPVEFVRLAQRRTSAPQPSEIGRALDHWLTAPSLNASMVMPNPAGDGEVKIAPFRLGLTDEIGALVASSKRANFPTPTETLLLRTAANQALVALQEARQLHEQKRAAEELERRVADRTAQLTAANEALRDSEKKYRTLFDSIDEGFCTVEVLFDENDKPIDYRFLEVNPSFEKQTGIQDARGRTMRSIVPHHEEHWFETYGRVALTGEPVRFESQAAQLHRWYDVYAFRIGESGDRKVAILFQDITERKQTETSLRRTQTYLSEGQRLSHTGSWAWSVKTKENLFWSMENYRIFGFDPDTESGQYGSARDRIHPADLCAFDETLEQAIQEQKDFEIDFRILLPGGEVKHVHNLGHPVLNNVGELVEYIGTTVDVTEQVKARSALEEALSKIKKSEASLRLSENYLAEAQRLSHTGSWARNLSTDKMLYWSEECYRVLGFDPRDGLLQFETFLQRVHPDDQDKVRKTAETARRDKADYEVAYRIVHPGGEIRDIHAVGHPVFGSSGDLVEYVGTVIDVTERKRAQVLLAGENRLLEMIAKGDTGALVLEALCRLVEELSERSLSSILLLDPKTNQLRHGAAPSLPAAYVEAIDGLVIGPCVGSCGTAAFLAKQVNVSDIATDPLWADFCDLALAHGLRACWSTPILSSTGKVLGTFAIYNRERHSPTALDHGVVGRIVHLASIAIEREQAETALRQAQADLAHVSRVTTMGELTASIAHEVNQPLTAVVNNANACLSLLPNEAPNLEEVRDALAEIIDDADRASAVITRVRQLAKNLPPERISLDLTDVITDILSLARYESATRRVTIRTELSDDLPRVSGDRVQLQQVLLNLVVNGMDAMNTVEESNRVLFIRGHRETRNGQIEAWVSVQDAGTGFRPEEMSRLFEAFYTTKPQGMGMGLAISRSIIEAHGGRLWAEPNHGPGATFLFSLPAADKAAL